MRARLLVAVALAGSVAVVPSAFGATARPVAAAPACTTTPSSWVAGTTDVCHGVVTYNDYVYDDYGADTGDIDWSTNSSALCPTAGDEWYAAGQENSADLVRLHLQRVGNQLRVTAELEALFQKTSTVLAVAIDTDNNPATGGGTWPGLDVSSTGWDEIAEFRVGNTESNVITGTMPLPTSSTWRVQAVTGIASTGHVMNVAFRGPRERAGFMLSNASNTDSAVGSWFEDRQAGALKSGDISAFGQTVSASMLSSSYSSQALPGYGLLERVYTSAYTIDPGEGVSVSGVAGRAYDQQFQYLGRYQPYAIYLPKPTGATPGLQFLFHGSNSNFTSLINQQGMESTFGDGLNRILVSPEMRGQQGYGSDISERDILDVWRDVAATYRFDPSRVIASGYSQGGYVAYRMSMLYPDRFAGVIAWVGFTGDDLNGTGTNEPYLTAGAIGNMIDFTGNLRQVPVVMLYSGADELVPINSSVAMERSFAATDDAFTFYLHPAAEHLTLGVLDSWAKEAADSASWRLSATPARVTFRTSSYVDDPALGIRHDRAYWVSAIRGRVASSYSDVDLTTDGCGGSVPVVSAAPPGAGPSPVPWVSQGTVAAPGVPLPIARRLVGSLANVGSLTVDVTAACLAGHAPVGYDVTTDGPATLSLSDGRSVTLPAAGHFTGMFGNLAT